MYQTKNNTHNKHNKLSKKMYFFLNNKHNNKIKNKQLNELKNKVSTKFICYFKLLLKHKFSDTCMENSSLLEIRVQASFFSKVNKLLYVHYWHFKLIIVVAILLYSFLPTPCSTQYLSGLNKFLVPTSINT